MGVVPAAADRDASLDALQRIAHISAMHCMWQFICSPSVHRLVLSGPSTDSKGQFVCIIYLRSRYFVFVGGGGSAEKYCELPNIHCKGEEWRGWWRRWGK